MEGDNIGEGAGAGFGGAIFMLGGTATLTGDTFTSNTATAGSGGTNTTAPKGVGASLAPRPKIFF